MNTQKTLFGTPEQKGNVTIYPAVPAEQLRIARIGKTKVAAYVRVSTDSAQQESSLDLQKEHYENHIKNNPEYEFVGIYEDDGVSATSVERRKGFLKMIEDCEAGKIDLILTKSVTRFTRNIGDLLSYVNLLNSLNPQVEVRFESEKISTIEKTGEMILASFGMLAQWESQSKSESITWAIDNRNAKGDFFIPKIYGYSKEKGRNNPLIINEEEAKVVRLCYAMVIKGKSFSTIANTLNTLGVRGRLGNTNWTAGGVIDLLSNEKYAGNVLIRKTVTPNFKTHKSKKNEGEKPQYFVEGNHEPIVPPLAYLVVQKIIKNRNRNASGIPYLKAVPKGILKGFVPVNKAIRGYMLSDYIEASRSVYEVEEDSEISIFADKISLFDLRNFNTVSTLFFEDIAKPSCLIKNGKLTFNAACNKMLGVETAELLFHPSKAFFAVRTPTNETKNQNVSITTSNSLPSFIPIALESAGLEPEYQYRIYGTKRTKNKESVMFFSLCDAKIISKEKNSFLVPKKHMDSFGNGFYENHTIYDLHKIDYENFWELSVDSKPTCSFHEHIAELDDFCQQSFAEFGLTEQTTNKK